LAGLLGDIDALGGACDAARVTITAEALDRGETTGGSAAMTPAQWVRHHAPTTRASGAGQVVALALAFAKRANALVKDAVASGRLPVRSAAAVVNEADKLRPLLADGAEPAVVDGLITMARDLGPRGCRMLRSALLAKYGREGVLQREPEPLPRRPRTDDAHHLRARTLTSALANRAMLTAPRGRRPFRWSGTRTAA
jgi:hypothetical protein